MLIFFWTLKLRQMKNQLRRFFQALFCDILRKFNCPFCKTMGVIHKLKKEVVVFIVACKTKEPDISCRRLVDTVQKNFDIKVSKSSINAIFKSSSLSSPVGRRSVAKKSSKKFQIPESKIKELFPQEKRTLIMEDTAPPEMSRMSKIKLPKETLREKATKDKAGLMSIQETKEEKSVPLATLGSVFLKSAINELTENSLLNQLFSSNFEWAKSVRLNNPDILLFLEMFGLRDTQNIEQSAFSGIWRLNNVLYNKAALSAIEAIKEECDFNKLKLAVAIELPQLFKEVNIISVYLSDGKQINLDGSFTSIWKEPPSIGLASSLYSAVSRINSEIIENVQTWNIDFINDGNIDIFGHLCQAVDKTSKVRLDKIVLRNFKNEEISSFPFIPGKKKALVCGLLPGQTSFQMILKACKLSQHYHEIQGDEKYYYRESSIHLNSFVMSDSATMVKVYFVSKNVEKEPFLAVITNNIDDSQAFADPLLGIILQASAASEGFKGYLQNAGREEGAIKKAFEEKKAFYEQQISLDYDLTRFISSSYNFNEILQTLLDQLNIFCQYRYFPLSCAALTREEMLSGFYALPGHFQETANYIKIAFKRDSLPREKIEKLNFAVRRVSEQKIMLEGKKLLLGII